MKPVSLRSLLLSLVTLGLVVAEAPLRAQAPAAKTEKNFVAYRITRGDILSIAIVGEPELTVGQKRVEAIGTVNLTYIGDIRLVGLTIKEAQETIENAYREQRILRNPTAAVVVEQYAPRSVRISGKVNSPGLIHIPPDTETTLLEIIFKANGLAETARGTAVRVTRTLPDGTPKLFTLDVESAIKGREKSTSPAAAFVVEPDDIIFVPEKII